MDVLREVPVLDPLLQRWRECLGEDFVAYRNHCIRVVNFCTALGSGEGGSGGGGEVMEKIAITAAFHDLGIWTDKTFDYLGPSETLARAYLAETGKGLWAPEIEAMIDNHHKLTRYRGHAEWMVEPFRKADWIDVSRGVLRFGLPRAFVSEVLATFPDAGFRAGLLALTRRRFRSHPFRPFPMMKL